MKIRSERASEATARVLLNAATEAALLIDSKGTIVIANETADKRLCTSGKAIMGACLYDVLPGELAGSTKAHIEKVIGMGIPERYEESYAGRVLSMGVFPVFDDRGQVERVAVFSRDITREKDIDRMKTEFVSIASHELRTPLSNITEAVAQVIDGIHGEISPEQQAILGIAHRNCERLGRLVCDLLDIARIESGKIVFNRTLVDVGRIVRKLCDANQGDALKKGLQLRHDVDSCVPLLFGDADRLEQVLVNLISNALQFTPSGGSIVVEVGREGESLRCVVSDTGIGIAPEHLETIFDKFVSFASAAHGGTSGTGLGLAIARQLVQLHGGELWAESEPNRGSRFIFRIPDYQSEAGLLEHLIRRMARTDAGHSSLGLLGMRVKEWPELQAQRGGKAPLFLRKLRDLLSERLDAGVNLWSLEDSGELVIVSEVLDDNIAQIRQAVLHQFGRHRFSLDALPVEFGLQVATAFYPGDAATAQQLRDLIQDRVCKAAPVMNAPKTVLIVDDDRLTVELLEAQLRQTPIRTLKAYSGEQAVELAARKAPDLILLDLDLPGINGYEVIGCLKEKISTSHIPLIIITGQDIDKKQFDASQSSIPVLTKPPARKALTDEVYRQLDIKVLEVETP